MLPNCRPLWTVRAGSLCPYQRSGRRPPTRCTAQRTTPPASAASGGCHRRRTAQCCNFHHHLNLPIPIHAKPPQILECAVRQLDGKDTNVYLVHYDGWKKK